MAYQIPSLSERENILIRNLGLELLRTLKTYEFPNNLRGKPIYIELSQSDPPWLNFMGDSFLQISYLTSVWDEKCIAAFTPMEKKENLKFSDIDGPLTVISPEDLERRVKKPRGITVTST